MSSGALEQLHLISGMKSRHLIEDDSRAAEGKSGRSRFRRRRRRRREEAARGTHGGATLMLLPLQWLWPPQPQATCCLRFNLRFSSC